MSNAEQAKIRQIRRHDRVVRWVITLGSMMIIASVLAILLLILGVTLPLFRPASSAQVARVRLPQGVSHDQVLAVGVELGTGPPGTAAPVGYAIVRDGTLLVIDLLESKPIAREKLSRPDGSPATRIESVERHAGSRYSLLWSDGSTSLVELTLAPDVDRLGRRSIKHSLQTLGQMSAEDDAAPRRAFMRASKEGNVVCAQLLSDNSVSIARQVVEENLAGDRTVKVVRTRIEQGVPGRITAMTLDREGQTLYAGTDQGRIVRWALDAGGEPELAEVVPAFRDKRTITALAMVFGDVSLAVGDSRGEVSTWFPVRDGGQARLRLAHSLGAHGGVVEELIPSQRNKAILSLAQGGGIALDYPTSERNLLRIGPDRKTNLQRIGYSTRGNAAIGLTSQGELIAWQIDCPHPEISWRTLFGRVLYEGYPEPVYAWQTTGGADFEPKFSLVPILLGTLKGTFYAMLLAVPVALMAAAYTSQFTTPWFKATIKPIVETLAAVPSVVLGFLIALWLAPIVERWILAVIASVVTIPLVFALFMALWQLLRRWDWAKRIENGYEFLVIAPVLLAGVGVAVLLMPTAERWLFEGNFRQWLYEAMHARFDQRNSIVIAFGLGFAVIPIIFSIAEDSLSTVPHSLTAASMALGASRWQTLWRVILPSGSPGIFAGTMIGFGRAVGETMIVLMATGNTPILDWSPLNGMRTLSANIAVEIPEAPVGGTLYRVLFLCAVLLFLLTFVLNTAAELVRQRLRRRYGRL